MLAIAVTSAECDWAQGRSAPTARPLDAHLVANEREEIAMPEPNQFFTSIELEAMQAATPSFWWRAFIQLGAEVGLRITETLWLSCEDVDASSCSISVVSTPQVFADGQVISRPRLSIHQERVLPISTELLSMLLRLSESSDSEPLLFLSLNQLDRLWPAMIAGARISARAMVPSIANEFAWIQRMARHRLANRLDVPLRDIHWPTRTLSALRNTFVVQNCGRPAGQHAAQLGVRKTTSRSDIVAQREDPGHAEP